MNPREDSYPPTPTTSPRVETLYFLPPSPYIPPLSSKLSTQSHITSILLPPPSIATSPAKLYGFPYWQLRLTQFAIDKTREVKSKTVMMSMRFYNPHNANVAALDLAQRCRSEGEIIMLIKERKLVDDCYLKEEIIVGNWELGGVTSLDSVYLLHEAQSYMAKREEGKLTGRIELCQCHDSKEVGN